MPLRQAYRADRLPHGLIFAGPTGVGKGDDRKRAGKVVSLSYARGRMSRAGSARAAVVFGSGNHPDHHVIAKELIRFHDKTGKSKGWICRST